MDETQNMIHPKINFLSSCETMTKLCTSEVPQRDRHRIDIPIVKGGKSKEGWDDGSQASAKPVKKIQWDLHGHE